MNTITVHRYRKPTIPPSHIGKRNVGFPSGPEYLIRQCSGPCCRQLKFSPSNIQALKIRCSQCGVETEWRIV